MSQQDIDMAVQAALETFPNDEEGNHRFREFIAKLFADKKPDGPAMAPGASSQGYRYGVPM